MSPTTRGAKLGYGLCGCVASKWAIVKHETSKLKQTQAHRLAKPGITAIVDPWQYGDYDRSTAYDEP